MSDLTTAKSILLTRCENGWIASNDAASAMLSSGIFFVFPSTEALAKALPRLLGKSEWRVEPERDGRGHFKSKNATP